MINNNQLVTRYYNLKTKNNELFKVTEGYVDEQVNALYEELDQHFVDRLEIDVQVAMDKAQKAAPELDPAELEVAVTNNIMKHLDDLGLSVLPPRLSEPNTIVAHLNFFNHSRYY